MTASNSLSLAFCLCERRQGSGFPTSLSLAKARVKLPDLYTSAYGEDPVFRPPGESGVHISFLYI